MLDALKRKLTGKADEVLRKRWVDYVRSNYPKYQSKPIISGFPLSNEGPHIFRKLGQNSPFLRRLSGAFLPIPSPESREPFVVYESPGQSNSPTPPTALLDQDIPESFHYYLPSFASNKSCVLKIPGGSFHGSDHTLFDADFRPIDWEPPFWALNCGLPSSLRRTRLGQAKKLKGSSLVLSAPAAGGNIWHFLFDSLPKIKLLEDAGMALQDFDHVLIDSLRMPYATEAIKRLGIDPRKVIESEGCGLISSDNMVYISMGCLLPPDPWVLSWLRSKFLPNQSRSAGSRKIFISRAGSKHRQLHDEATIARRLKAEGFEVIRLETLTLTRQIELFSEAESVVASHGAGLTNLTWCAPGTRVVELFAPEYLNVCYWNISEMLGLDYSFAVGEPTIGALDPTEAVLNLDCLQSDQVFPDIKILIKRILAFTS